MARSALGSTRGRPLLLWACAAAIVPALALEMVLLPNLRSNPGFLTLVVLTTLVVPISVGLTLSGRRRQLPPPARLGLTFAVWSLAAADLAFFLVLPLALPQKTASEGPVRFASQAPSSVPGSPSTGSPAAAPGPATLSGTFDARQGVDTVSGSATVGRTTDGKVVLSLSNLNATPGPDLFVYLSTAESPAGDAQVKSGIEVGRLRATRGDLNYELDPNLDYAKFKSVAVYCKSFSVVFGYANLK